MIENNTLIRGSDRLQILSGTAYEAAEWCRRAAKPFNTVRYVASFNHLRGLMDPEYVVVGTFWNRHDAVQIWAALVSACKTHPPGAPPEYEAFLHKTLPVLPILSIPNPTPKEPILHPITLEDESPTPKKKKFKSIKP